MGLEIYPNPSVFTSLSVNNLVGSVANITNVTISSVSNLSVTSLTGTNLVTQAISFVAPSVFAKSTFNNLVSALAIQINGVTRYLPLLSAV